MEGILILLVLVIAGFAARRWYVERFEQRLRENPPERRVIRLALPGGTKDSPKAMARAIRQAAPAAFTGRDGRREGTGQLDFAYVFTVPAPESEPVMECWIWGDPDKIDAVKRAVKQVFPTGSLEVNEMNEDALAEIAEHFRPRPEEDPDAVAVEEPVAA